jgi:hypothetical protein
MLLVLGFVLAGCSPADYVNLLNATGDQITVIMDKSQRVVTIPTGVSADFSLVFRQGDHLIIRTSKRSWTYSPRSLFAPPSFLQSHTMVMRAFARIDGHGHIYLLTPPRNNGAPREIEQPSGFPVKPYRSDQLGL